MRGKRKGARGARSARSPFPTAASALPAGGTAADAHAYRDPVVDALEQRAYTAAALNRLNSDWSVSHLDANEEIRRALTILRAASRNMERNSDLYRRFLGLVTSNVVHRGFQLQSQPRDASGEIDEAAAAQIETRWKRWAKGRVTLDGKLTWAQLQRLAIRAIARDGEIILRRHVRGGELRLEVLEADHLPVEQHVPRDRTYLGITFDPDMRPAVYWLTEKHPGGEFGGFSRFAVRATPASEVLHTFISERANQARGVPWGTASFDDLLMLLGYKVAELAAARLAAARPVSIETERGADDRWTGDRTTEQGTIEFDGAPGGITRLYPGQKLVPLGSDHPKSAYGPFTTEIKRDAAAGLEVSYHSLNSDLGAANFSSLRHGRADEIRRYESVQDFFGDDFCSPVFLWWLELDLTRPGNPLPLSKFEKFAEHVWVPPTFEPLDPGKEAEAIEKELELGLTTRTDEAAKRGRDFVELVRKRKSEEQLLDDEEVELGPKPKSAPAAPPPPAPQGDA